MKHIALFLLASTTGVAQTMTMALNSVSAAPGNTAFINLQLNAQAGSGPAGLEWTVNAPTPDVQSITAALGPAASAASKSIYCSGKTCVIAGMNSSTIGNGTVAVLTVQLSASAQGNLAIQLSNTSAASPQAAALAVTSAGGVVSVNSPPVSITLTPASVTLTEARTQQFSASVSGTANVAVTWSMSPQLGQLSSSGLYTAPYTAPSSIAGIAGSSTVTITATSNADPAKSASATVTLLPPPCISWSPCVVTSKGFPIGAWLLDRPNSKWIAPRTDAGNSNAGGSYTYHTTFDLTGFDPATAVLTGQFAADNSALIKLNGIVVGPRALTFSSWTRFTINSRFAAGLNSLDFVVTNDGCDANPTGLRVDIGGTASRSK